MADPKGNDSKPVDGKTEAVKPGESKGAGARSAAVKPPVLDMKAKDKTPGAKPTDADSKPADKPGPSRSTTGAVPPPHSAGQAASRRGFAFGASLAGGVLGLAAAYGLAWAGLWPTTQQPLPPSDPRVEQVANAVPELRTVTETTQSELATLTQRVGALEDAPPAQDSAAPAPEPVDLSPLQSELASLQQRVDSLANAPEPELDTGDIDAVRGELTDLTGRLDELGSRLGTAEASLRTLDTTVSQNSAALEQQPENAGAVLQLPLVLSGLESAFANGRPFEAELSALRSAAPSIAVPPTLAEAAASGLPRPDQVAARFSQVVPAMMAERPADPDAGWQQGAVDWVGSLIALRPVGEREGDSPEAVMSRLEAAVERRDFAGAEILLAALPAPMRAKAGEVSGQIIAQAEAGRFIEAVRTQALAVEETP